MKLAVTGAHGFLGWHLRCRLLVEGTEVRALGRAEFADPELLRDAVRWADAVVHIAGVNRAEPGQVRAGNVELATTLATAIGTEGRPIVFANSIRALEAGEYGEAKAEAAAILRLNAESNGQPFTDLLFPHLFGEYGKPFYNSAVHTFSHHLALGETPEVNGSGSVELLHAQDAAKQILAALASGAGGQVRVTGRPMTIPEVWDVMSTAHRRYVTDGTIPRLEDELELRLFNTIRSHMYLAGKYPLPLVNHSDPRGSFVELVRADGLGQTSFSTTVPGVTRGDHFHFDKIERFVVVGGTATIKLRRLFDDQVSAYVVSGDQPVVVDMPPLTTHSITNTGESMLTTIFWAADHFDPRNPDTYPALVEGSEQ